jgi:xanthine dehydrogenase YagS FAD-binding subunit
LTVNAFEYVNPDSLKAVPKLLRGAGNREVVLIAGGMDLLGELKDELIAPEQLVNLKSLPELKYIRHDAKGLRIGATTTLSEILADAKIQADYPGLAQAADSVASIQVRNVGTIGGNLCQRPRCWYYRNPEFPCLKKGGNFCYAVGGNSKYHAILGGDPCFIVHPSDLAPALIALGASVHTRGARGTRELPVESLYVLPKDNVSAETVLAVDEVITEVVVPAPLPGSKSVYLKFKEKGTMDFAMAAAAVSLQVQAGQCRAARIVLGGVAPKPWPVPEAERLLVGQAVTEAAAEAASEVALKGADPLDYNAYKVPLTKALVKRAILAAAKG